MVSVGADGDGATGVGGNVKVGAGDCLDGIGKTFGKARLEIQWTTYLFSKGVLFD